MNNVPNLSENDLRQWIAHNDLLQKEYKKYRVALHSNNRRDQLVKEQALANIERALQWSPFVDFVSGNSYSGVTGISRYGLDSDIEHCIGLIDEIAHGEL